MTDNGYSGNDLARPIPVGSWFFLLLIASGALLLLLGTNSLTGIEGDTAESCRRLIAAQDLFAADLWHPDSIRTVAYSRLLEPLVLLLGRAEWVLRLPSVIAALLLLVGTGILTYELTDSRRLSLFSEWLLLGSYGFLFWGRCAHPAMLESCCILWGAVILFRRKPWNPYLRSLLWFLLLLLLWLFNGMIGMAMLFFITLPVIFGEIRHFRFPFPATAGAWLTILPLSYGALFLCFRGSLPWRGWTAEWRWMQQLFAALHQDAWIRLSDGYYSDWWYAGAENLCRLILPWPPLCLLAAVALWKERRELSPDLKQLMLSTLLIFVSFGIFPARRWQIILPLLPFLCTMTAEGLGRSRKYLEKASVDFSESFCDFGKICRNWVVLIEFVTFWFCALAASAAMALPLTWPIWKNLFNLPPPVTMMVVVPLLGTCAIASLIFTEERNSAAEKLTGISGRIAGTVLACAALSGALLAVALPALTEFRTERAFWLRARSAMPQNGRVIFVGKSPSSQALFYLDAQHEIRTAFSAAELKKKLVQPGRFLLIGRNEERVAKMLADAGVPVNPLKPGEVEDTPIRLFRTEDPQEKWSFWSGFIRENHNNKNMDNKEKK